MTATLLNARDLQSSGTSLGPPSLESFVLQLVGEPFLFTRQGYADELTVHFGIPRPAAHPKLLAAGVRYGSFVLKARDSAWLLTCVPQRRLVAHGFNAASLVTPAAVGGLIGKAEIDGGGLLVPGAVVVKTRLFRVPEAGGIGFRLELSDESAVTVLPTADTQPATTDGEPRPVADWELVSPLGTALVGPREVWSLLPPK